MVLLTKVVEALAAIAAVMAAVVRALVPVRAPAPVLVVAE